jgi:hypothetical protein
MKRERKLLFALVLLIPLCLSADIFWLFKKSTSRVLQDMGGESVYSTPVQVNGSPGTLTAYSFDKFSSLEIGRELKQRLAVAKDATISDATMITAQEEGRVQKFLVLPSTHGGSASVVLMFEQSLQEMKKRSSKEALEWPEGLSMLPGTPRFTAACAATRTTFVTAETATEPTATLTAVESALKGAGWTALPLSTPTFKLFVRDTKTCVAIAMRSAGATQTTLSVMQRDGSGKKD